MHESEAIINSAKPFPQKESDSCLFGRPKQAPSTPASPLNPVLFADGLAPHLVSRHPVGSASWTETHPSCDGFPGVQQPNKKPNNRSQVQSDPVKPWVFKKVFGV